MYNFGFEKLEVYQRAITFINKIFELTERLPNKVQYSLGDQLRRASLSIANNIAEGSGRRSKAEKSRFWSFAQSSAFECVPLLTILHCRKYVVRESYKVLYDECFQISKMLSGLINAVK